MHIIYNYCVLCGEEFPHDEDLWIKPWWKERISDEAICCDEVVCYKCFLLNYNYEIAICPVCKISWWLGYSNLFDDI